MTFPSTAASPATDTTDLPPVDAAAAVIEGEVVNTPDAKPPVESSTADAPDANKPANLLDVIKSAVEPVAAPEASSAPKGEEVDPAAEAVVAEATTEPTAEDDAKLPFHNHPRWQEMLKERNSLLEPAQRYSNITTFMQTHGLVPDEVAEGFEVMALLKSGDPTNLTKARDWFASRLTMLDESLGNVLPDDLRERVEGGLIDEEGAQELARARAAETLRAAQTTANETKTAEDKAAEAVRTVTAAMATAVEAWEARVKASDPDYSKKAKMVEDKCLAIVARTAPPKTAEEATALADKALAEVNADLKALLPTKRPITPGPSGSSATAAAAPTTLKEAIAAGLARTA